MTVTKVSILMCCFIDYDICNGNDRKVSTVIFVMLTRGKYSALSTMIYNGKERYAFLCFSRGKITSLRLYQIRVFGVGHWLTGTTIFRRFMNTETLRNP